MHDTSIQSVIKSVDLVERTLQLQQPLACDALNMARADQCLASGVDIGATPTTARRRLRLTEETTRDGSHKYDQGTRLKLCTETKNVQSDIASNQQSLDEATALRKKQRASFSRRMRCCWAKSAHSSPRSRC